MSTDPHRDATSLTGKQTADRGARSLAQRLLWCLPLRACAFFLCSAGLAAPAAVPAFLCEGYMESKNTSKDRQVPTIDARIEFRVENNPAAGTLSIFDLKSPPRVARTHADDLIDLLVVRNARETNHQRTIVQVSRLFEGYPVDWEWDQRMLWFAYCAQEYLRGRDGQHVIIPGGDPRHDPHVAACRATIQWRSQDDIAPASVEFRVDPELLQQAPAFFKLQPPGKILDAREERYQALMKVLKKEQLMGRFQVKKWISFEKMNVPEEWTLERHDSSGKVTRIYEGKTTAVKPLSGSTPLILPENAHVVDKRVRSVAEGINWVNYSVSNGQFLEWKSPALAALAARRISRNQHVRPPDLWLRRTMFSTAIAAILFAPVGVMLLRKIRRKKQQVSERTVSGKELKQT